VSELPQHNVVSPMSAGWAPPEVDTSVAHPARMYNYFLKGKDNYPVDRAAAAKVLEFYPEAFAMAQANRAFLGRAVRFLAGAGVRQFLDIGTGIPGAGGTGEVAHAVAPGSHVVCVDNDPIVLAHSRALLVQPDLAPTTVVQADLRRPEEILNHPEVRAAIDFDQPVALMLVAVLHFVTDREDPRGILDRLLKALPSGSYLAVSHVTADFDSERARAAAAAYDKATAPIVLRPQAAVEEFFNGLELVEPGVAHLPWWRPDGEPPEGSDRIWYYCGVARKP
jgi:SAM-dependent methyltransferase